MTYLDVIVPGPWWNALTYIYKEDDIPPSGSRVRVPVRNTERVGFVSGVADDGVRLQDDIEYKEVTETLDNESVFGGNLWNLALWAGHYFMCGAGEVLKVISPKELLNGDPVTRSVNACGENEFGKRRAFSESECYIPYDSERLDFYINRLMELEEGCTALVLFPECSNAKNFYGLLPDKMKDNALLWKSKGTKGFWRSWQDVHDGSVKFVIGGPDAVYAPFPDVSLIIVEDEANPAYVPVRFPNLPARSLAGKLACISESELILGGRLPSAKTYSRKKGQM